MITVYEHLHEYCTQRNLPPPSTQDLRSCGALIKHHFKNFWGRNQEVGILVGFGFKVTGDDENKIVTMIYPDHFKPEMDARIDKYYQKKNPLTTIPSKEAEPPPAPPTLTSKKRKRIPVSTPVKERSAKPSTLGQIQGL